MTTFYFTMHPGDLIRERIIPGSPVMVVAHAFWDDNRKRFKIRRPPADATGSLVIDSGGFVAARKWGRYPWVPEQYAAFIREESRDVPVTWAACMDYACEREVNREALQTNQERIGATIANEIALRDCDPGIPWLGVLQGNTLDERVYDLERRRSLGLLSALMGVGSICGRGARESATVLRFYRRELPDTMFHAFGLDVRTFDVGDDLWDIVASWDSYAWNWPRGRKNHDRPAFLHQQAGERLGAYSRRLAEHYASHTIGRRLSRPRQLPLMDVSA